MSQPTKYTRAERLTSVRAVTGVQADAECDRIKTTTDAICDNLALIQRDDGLLRNGLVTMDSLSPATLALMGEWNPRGAWVTASVYAAKDVVTSSGVTYVCTTSHIAGTFATDLAAGKWQSLNFEPNFAGDFTLSGDITFTGGASFAGDVSFTGEADFAAIVTAEAFEPTSYVAPTAGMYRPEPGVLGFSVGDTSKRVFLCYNEGDPITGGGPFPGIRLGIGTMAATGEFGPGAPLEVEGDWNGFTAAIIRNRGSTAPTPNASDTSLATGLVVSSDLDDLEYQIVVNGGYNTSAGGARSVNHYYHTGNFVIWSNYSAQQRVITCTPYSTGVTGGRVGIGDIAAPGARLHVKTLDAVYPLIVGGTTRGLRVATDSSKTTISGTDQTGSASFQPLDINGSEVTVSRSGTLTATFNSSGNLVLVGALTAGTTVAAAAASGFYLDSHLALAHTGGYTKLYTSADDHVAFQANATFNIYNSDAHQFNNTAFSETFATIDTDGINLGSGRVLKANGTQILGARDTGWAAMTGSADKGTTYDVSTVTISQLAGRVVALQAALTTHGLIGA